MPGFVPSRLRAQPRLGTSRTPPPTPAGRACRPHELLSFPNTYPTFASSRPISLLQHAHSHTPPSHLLVL
eukprot:353178-Chlamydomonas_euryale.AAC.2